MNTSISVGDFLAMLRHILTTKHSLLTPSFTFTDYGTQTTHEILKTMNRKSNYIHIYIWCDIIYSDFSCFFVGFFCGCSCFLFVFLCFLWLPIVFLLFFSFVFFGSSLFFIVFIFSLGFQRLFGIFWFHLFFFGFSMCWIVLSKNHKKKNSNSQIAYFDKPWHLWN